MALVAKVAEGVSQMRERQKGIADTLSQLRGRLPSQEDGCPVNSDQAAAAAGPST